MKIIENKELQKLRVILNDKIKIILSQKDIIRASVIKIVESNLSDKDVSKVLTEANLATLVDDLHKSHPYVSKLLKKDKLKAYKVPSGHNIDNCNISIQLIEKGSKIVRVIIRCYHVENLEEMFRTKFRKEASKVSIPRPKE